MIDLTANLPQEIINLDDAYRDAAAADFETTVATYNTELVTGGRRTDETVTTPGSVSFTGWTGTGSGAFLGVRSFFEHPVSSSVGDEYINSFYAPVCHLFRKQTFNTWIQINLASFDDTCYTSRPAAEASVTAVDQIRVYPRITGVVTPHRVAAYSPPSNDQVFQYFWQPWSEQTHFEAPISINPDTGNARLTLSDGKIWRGDTSDQPIEVDPETGIYEVPADDVTYTGENIALANVPPLTQGVIIHFVPKGNNTGTVFITVGGETYQVFKASSLGGAEIFDGGELENGQPVQFVHESGVLYWWGTTLGSAARRDVGIETGELVALNADGRVSSTLLGANPVVGYSLSQTANGAAWTEDISGQTETETDARYILKSGDTMAGNFIVEHTSGTAILSRVPGANQTVFQGQRQGETFSFFSLDGEACGSNANPGLAFGIGGTANRDVYLCRGGNDLLQTPDGFEALSLDVLAAGLAETKVNLEILSNAAEVPTNTVAFDGPLSANEINVQRALDVLDNAVDDNSRRVVLSEEFLEYQINEGADQFYPGGIEFSWNGNLYLALSDIAVHRFRVRAHPTQTEHGDRSYYGGAWKVTRTDLITYPAVFGTYSRGRIRHGTSGSFSSNPVIVTLNTDAELEVQFDTAFRVQTGEYFVMAVHQSEIGSDTLHSLPNINETSHAGDPSYPHETIEFISRARESGPLPDQGINSYLGPPLLGNPVLPAFTEMDYGVLDAGISTIRDEGTQIYHGLTHLNFAGEGVTATHDAVNDWANISIPGGGGDDAYDWATEGNADLIPASKIPDLDAAKIVSGTFASARIPFEAGTVESLLESQITYTSSGTTLEFDGYGTGNALFGSIKAFQYRAAFTASNSGMRASYNGDAFANIVIKGADGANRQMTLNDFDRYDYFMIQKASPNWILVGGSVAASAHPDSYTNALADARISPWARNFGASGTAPTARLGTGTASTGTFLRGDGTWADAGSADGVVQGGQLTFQGRSLVMTLDRSLGGDIVASVPSLADEFVDTFDATVTGTNLQLTLGRAEGADLTATAVLPTGGGGTALDIAGLPEQSSNDLADVDLMVIENVSESNVQRHLTMGSLSAFLADGTTITSSGGKLTTADLFGNPAAARAGKRGGNTLQAGGRDAGHHHWQHLGEQPATHYSG